MEIDFYSTTEEEKEYAAFKIQQYYRKIEHFNSLSLRFINEMILFDRVKIQFLPFELRTAYKGFYLSAFRVSRNVSNDRFMDDVMLLYKDLQSDFDNKKSYMEMLLSSLDYYDFQGVEKFETIKTDITNEILFKLSITK